MEPGSRTAAPPPPRRPTLGGCGAAASSPPLDVGRRPRGRPGHARASAAKSSVCRLAFARGSVKPPSEEGGKAVGKGRSAPLPAVKDDGAPVADRDAVPALHRGARACRLLPRPRPALLPFSFLLMDPCLSATRPPRPQSPVWVDERRCGVAATVAVRGRGERGASRAETDRGRAARGGVGGGVDCASGRASAAAAPPPHAPAAGMVGGRRHLAACRVRL